MASSYASSYAPSSASGASRLGTHRLASAGSASVGEDLPRFAIVAHPPIAKGCTLVGGTWRPRRAAELLPHTAPSPPQSGGEGARRSASEGRLRTGSSRLSTGMSQASNQRSPVDGMWKHLAPMSRFDHVASLLQQPLPTRGMDNTHDYVKRNKYGPLPVPPEHIVSSQSVAHCSYIHDEKYSEATKAQQASELWRGFPRDLFSEYTEQKVKQGHIMRNG
mmetsp:Transcript_97091/g.274435  ORF Transcript_97091/g.274435 Transcript_97091/m.274435 type:complete len:220 (-) Transcript_97091:83-742(-)|eukprot:CAMPEP_0117588538 /NCGR_PEP_ID=MMETSP0784-20121206/69908_1 /TAXON_ID=39447 /ORGANISM="" /LENGTH=219 /DNA_ID=CAMNT_0005389911 /DNA_START=28 /DNA_END=687 /DNA_ORIENTATION=+